MALLSGPPNPLDANTDTIATLVAAANLIIDELREHVVTANSGLANTNGNCRINGLFISNTSFVTDGFSVGDFIATLESGNTTIAVTDTTGINDQFVLEGEGFTNQVNVVSVGANSIVVDIAPTVSKQFVGTIDTTGATDKLFLSRFGLGGGEPGSTDAEIDTANLYIVTNTVFTTDANLVTVEANLQVDTDSLFFGNVQAQSTVQFANNDSFLEFKGANQDFVWISTDTLATIRTDGDGSLEFNADAGANSVDPTQIKLKVDDISVAQFNQGGDVAFYDTTGTDQLLVWDATNLTLGVNTDTPQQDVALDVVGNTHTLDLNVANQTTSGNVVVNDELRGNTTLFVTTDTEFTNSASQVLIRNDLFVEGDAQVSQNLTVNTDSLFVGNVEAQSTIEFTGSASTMEFAGANQDFIFGATKSLIRTNANGSLIIDADKTDNGADITEIRLRIDDKTAASYQSDQIGFFDTSGANTRLHWDRTNLRLGVNTAFARAGLALDVVGNTQTNNLIVEFDGTVQRDLAVTRNIAGSANLTINVDGSFGRDLAVTRNTTIGQDLSVTRNIVGTANLTISNTASIGQDLTVARDASVTRNLAVTANTSTSNLSVTNTVSSNLIPGTTLTHRLGNTTFQWLSVAAQDASFSGNVGVDGTLSISTDLSVAGDISVDNLTVSGNASISDTLTVENLIVPGTGSVVLPATISFSGTTDFENINVTGVASFANLEVSSLVTNTAALIGTSGVVSSTTPTKIDDFDKEVSQGFKYIIHGKNDNPTSAYAIEINCSHNGANVFFTRFGEVSNNFDCSLTPVINGSDVELIADCPSASGSNVHSFSIVRIETR